MDKIPMLTEAVKRAIPTLEYRLDEPMREHTSFRIGGAGSVMYFPRTPAELAEVYGMAREFETRAIIIGNGTNMLISDDLPEMAAIKTTALCSLERAGECGVIADAGVPLARLSEFASKNGLAGLEFAYGIPGSAGGAVTMNAGAYGSEMKDVVRSSVVYSPELGIFTIAGEQHGFSYRSSRFSGAGEIVLSSTLIMEKGGEESIRAKMEELSARRRGSQPLDMPSAGSAFKRPEGGYAAELIEKSGLKGYSVGGAQVSEKHAGFIVNRGEATFSDVVRLIGHIQETVFEKFGVELEPEVKIVR